jgi:alanyl-tRNA synthetase
MTSAQIRQSFLDFFKSKGHTIVPSSSLMPDAPNLLFTNAGMNQFVPIFLGQQKPDVSKWPGAIPGLDSRAADTQKCIRAGGKHNDLEDVGLDTYHHTFFEMLGNWSFGDYFKKEAIDWAWELVVQIWKFPAHRLYATVYSPDKSKGDPSEFDQEAWNHWAEKFRAAGLDPALHIINGGKKDNFWMMGETGPCGPCSELHVDLTPQGDTRGALVNKGSAECIEIWNLVFIQFNANPDGTFSPLPAKHVDTGMGFERVTGILQCTKQFTDFKSPISNYETDIFRPLFDKLEQLSGKKYGSMLPAAGQSEISDPKSQIAVDIAFRVIADHIRTLSFAIADGIQPGNTDRNYVLRRILRRAVRYGRTLGFHEPFFYKLVDVLVETMGHVFPEIREKRKPVQEVIQREEEAFNKTLDRGIEVFEAVLREAPAASKIVAPLEGLARELTASTDADESIGKIGRLYASVHNLWVRESGKGKAKVRSLRAKAIDEALTYICENVPYLGYQGGVHEKPHHLNAVQDALDSAKELKKAGTVFSGANAFELYDTYGFPLDLTELMARERGLTVDTPGFEKLMEEQRARARAAQKKTIVEVSQIETTAPTKFIGYETLLTKAKVLEVVGVKDKAAVVLDTSSAYAEMGGQVGDTGELTGGGQIWRITNTQKSGNTWLHFTEGGDAPPVNSIVTLAVEVPRREAIQRHHTVTHLFHWALHEVVSKEASQKGSYVGPDKLTFDFNSAPLTPQQVADIEKLVNERILENAGVSWTEVPYADVKSRKDVMQFFGEKYGETVRVVQIGGHPTQLDGYSMELCGGTHTRATGEIGLFRIVAESAIAAGVRRIEAVAGLEAYRNATDDLALIKSLAGKVNSPIGELEKKVESLLAHQKELEKALRAAIARNAAQAASWLLGRVQTVNGIPLITQNFPDADAEFLQAVVDALKSRFKGVVILGGGAGGSATLVAAVTPDFTSKVQAGKIIQQIAPIVGGKGGGKPDNARGGGKDASRLDEALAKAKEMLG